MMPIIYLPDFRVVPSMIEASISILPAAFKHDPFPASKAETQYEKM
jgi:hypothetical protein